MDGTKSHALLGNQYHYNDQAKRFISAKHERLAEIVHDYDDSLDLAFIPTQTPPDPQYAIIEWAGENAYYVNSWWHENELDDRILIHLFQNDFNKRNPDEIFNEVEARRIAKQLMWEKEEADRVAEQWDFVVSLMKSPLHTYKHDGQVFKD